jgi:hypothetical protein
MVLCILPGSEAIDAFHDIFPGELRVVFGHALALQDGMRIVLTGSNEYPRQEQWDVGPTIWRGHTRA